MCIQDWQIGRHIKTHEVLTGLVATDTVLLTPDTNRVVAIFGLNPTGSLSTIFLTGGSILSPVFVVNQSEPATFILTAKDHGDIVTKGFTLNTSGCLVSVIEGTLPSGVLDLLTIADLEGRR